MANYKLSVTIGGVTSSWEFETKGGMQEYMRDAITDWVQRGNFAHEIAFAVEEVGYFAQCLKAFEADPNNKTASELLDAALHEDDDVDDDAKLNAVAVVRDWLGRDH